MKTVEEFIKELEGSETLQSEFEALGSKEALEDFLKKNGCGFTAEEYITAVNGEGELDDDSAADAAGGIWTPEVKYRCVGCRQRYSKYIADCLGYKCRSCHERLIIDKFV